MNVAPITALPILTVNGVAIPLDGEHVVPQHMLQTTLRRGPDGLPFSHQEMVSAGYEIRLPEELACGAGEDVMDWARRLLAMPEGPFRTLALGLARRALLVASMQLTTRLVVDQLRQMAARA